MSVRQLLPKPPFVPALPLENAGETQAPKRQGVSLACDRCRKRKVKCNGVRPACAPCCSANVECKYTTRGSSLAQRYVGLQESYNELRQAVEAMCSGSERDAVDILKHIRLARGMDNIIPSLCSHPSVVQYRLLSPEQQSAWVKDARPVESSGFTPPKLVANCTEQQYLLPVSQWTTVSQDDIWLSHLLRLFWTWDTTLTRIIHRDLLVDMISTRHNVNESHDGKVVAQFCSELLINALLAYSSDCFGYVSQHKPIVRGREFAKEAYRLLETRSVNNCVSLLQAVAILSMYENAFGDVKKGASLFFETLVDLRSTLEPVDESMVLNNAPLRQKVQDALSFISSGFYCLDVKMCLIASPTVPAGWTRQLLANDGNGTSPNMQPRPDTLWIPYPLSVQPRISYSFEASQIEHELVRLTAECLEATGVNEQSLMPNHLGATNIYNRLIRWKNVNARRFRGSSSILPSWTGILAFYHTTCIKLLSPFIQLPFLEFPRGRPARALSLEHSESLISILKEYNATFAGRQDYWLLHTCEIAVKHLLLEKNLLNPTEDYLAKGCELLYSTGRYMPQANRILAEVNNHIKERNIEISDRIKTMLQAGSARVRPTIIANASYLQFGPTDAKRVPFESMAFNETVKSVES